jgi:Arc/MetJ-type ribon-helix-helix transcriptional regulator
MIITQKISLNLPVAYVALIDNDVVDEGLSKSRSAFIERAIKHELETMKIDLIVRESPGKFEDWGWEMKYKIIDKKTGKIVAKNLSAKEAMKAIRGNPNYEFEEEREKAKR